jgi:hypothetical protein
MKKFVIHSSKGTMSVLEVECVKLSKAESPLFNLADDQWMAKITAPESLYEKREEGKSEPPIWCWWAFHETAEECLEKLRKDAEYSILRAKSKRKSKEPDLVVEASPDEIEAIMSAIKVIKL